MSRSLKSAAGSRNACASDFGYLKTSGFFRRFFHIYRSITVFVFPFLLFDSAPMYLNLPMPRTEIICPSRGSASVRGHSAPSRKIRPAAKRLWAFPRLSLNTWATSASIRSEATCTVSRRVRKSSPAGGASTRLVVTAVRRTEVSASQIYSAIRSTQNRTPRLPSPAE